jgi:dTDP-4-dehydrorhamnose reductase
MRRNADAVASLAAACREREVPLVLVSTNEVFDGERGDGRGYTETDTPRPANPYGASKLAGEQAAQRAFGGVSGLWIARTAWLYGPPGNDFPEKILAASDKRAEEDPLPVVADETGSPTFARDLARALLELVQSVDRGLFHLVNAGSATRYEWAQAVLARCRPGRLVRPIERRDFARDSSSPAWGVLDCQAAADVGVVVRGWRSALADYLASICAASPSVGLARSRPDTMG